LTRERRERAIIVRSRRLFRRGVRPLKRDVREQQFVPQREIRKILGPDGAVLGTAEYLDEVLDGVSRIYSTAGVLTQESHFSGGELHGPYRSWWENGHPKEQGEYVRGKRCGRYVWHQEDGSVLKTHEYGAAL
jgi:antitoxin component YwqK of YwqJK toxin-antitoxin module